MTLFLLNYFSILIPVLISSGFFTLFERKVMGSMQFREGPSKVLFIGFFQPICDALKLFSKTNFSPEVSMELVYFVSPIVMMLVSLLPWITFPLTWNLLCWYSSILFVQFCFSVSVYGLILSGWFSRSKYAVLGCIRAFSQSVSYEIPLAFVLLMFMLAFSLFSFDDLVSNQEWIYFVFPFFFILFVFVLVILAEVNRSPFDLAEGESELVSGFSVELGSSSFVVVFLGEYVSLLWSSLLTSVIFFGNVNLVFSFKILFILFIFVWIRSSVPRVRFDRVIMLCWLLIFPIVISSMFLSILFLFNQSQSSGVFLLKMLLN